jgi:two-component system cell cycle response regulator
VAAILVIEDNAENLELMSYLLTAFGHSTTLARNGEAGIVQARRQSPDLIVCDVHLPGVDGYSVVRALKGDAALNMIPIIAVSALAMVGDSEKGIAAGFDGYISKPIDPERFVGEIDAYLRPELRGSLPVRPAGQPSLPHAPHRATQGSVLVIDDSPTNCELIEQTLRPFGFAVRTAASVREGLALAATEIPDLFLSDLHMPGEDGFELIRRIKADPKLASVPFLFISSSVWGERDREMAHELGINKFLLRPIEPQVLIDEIVACLRVSRAARHESHPGR